jgi:hypothetical protein
MNVDGQLEQEAAAHRHTHAIQWQVLQAAGASKVSNAGITMLKALQGSRVGGIRPQHTAVPLCTPRAHLCARWKSLSSLAAAMWLLFQSMHMSPV